jgi:two-component system, NtrC family, nitrogen regulation response regulator GlnG
VSLLRALESGEIQRVGGSPVTEVDVRLFAGTDADLEAAIADGRFRLALLHRLAGYEIVIPPLRERRDDFGRLLFHFLREELREIGEERRLAAPEPGGQAWMPASIVARLARCDWPGNVRQLRNVARQLVIESRGTEVVRVGPQVEKLLREPAPLPPLPPPARLRVSRPSLYLMIERCPGVRKASDLGRPEILECQARCAGDPSAMAAELEVSRSGLLQRMRRLGLG